MHTAQSLRRNSLSGAQHVLKIMKVNAPLNSVPQKSPSLSPGSERKENDTFSKVMLEERVTLIIRFK